MDIKMFNVNFGEAILYEDSCEKLLVDCGAKFDRKGKTAYSKVENEINNEISLMITHFDEDHYNGILEIQEKKFKKIYLPLYIWNNNTAESTEKLFKDTVKACAFLTILKSKKLDLWQKLFCKLPELVENLSDIVCVGKGDCIPLGKQNLNVIWPQEDPEIKSFTIKHLEKIENEFKSSVNNNEYENILNIVNSYTDSFISLYRLFIYNNDNQNRDELLLEFNRIQENLKEKYNQLIQLKINIPAKEKKHIFYHANKLIKNMNSCSIVWHTDTYLACSDISPTVIKYLKLKKDLNDDYLIIKSPHHGTKNYYSCNLPKTELFLISNSGDKKCDWKISEIYPKTTICCCTNDSTCRCLNSIYSHCSCSIGKISDYRKIHIASGKLYYSIIC